MTHAVRRAREHDAAAIAALVQSAYRGDSSRAGWTTEADLLDDVRVTPAAVAAMLADPRTTMLVLDDAAGIVATCRIEDRGAAPARFGMFAVRPTAQGAGTGRRMVAAAEAHARDALRATVLELQVLHPRTELIAWYVRLGFAPTGERRPFAAAAGPAAEPLDFVVLGKPL